RPSAAPAAGARAARCCSCSPRAGCGDRGAVPRWTRSVAACVDRRTSLSGLGPAGEPKQHAREKDRPTVSSHHPPQGSPSEPEVPDMNDSRARRRTLVMPEDFLDAYARDEPESVPETGLRTYSDPTNIGDLGTADRAGMEDGDEVGGSSHTGPGNIAKSSAIMAI